MKRLLSLLALLCLVCTGAWASVYHLPGAQVTELTEGYYFIGGCKQNSQDYYYLYDTGSAAKGNMTFNGETYVWKVTPVTGGYTIQNKGTNRYLTVPSGNGSALSTSTDATTLQASFSGNIVCIHNGTEGIDMTASGENPTSWAGTTPNGSRTLKIYAAEESASAQVTYVYKIGGREWSRSTQFGAIGQPVPAPEAKAFATLSYDQSQTVASDGSTVVEVTCTPQLPFTAFESAAAITQWYAFRAHNNSAEARWLYDNEGALGFLQGTHPQTAEYAWGFVGNLIDGFEIVNMKNGLILSDESPCTLSTTHNRVTLCKSNVNNSGFAMKTTGDYYNYNSGSQAIKRWQDADNGSTFFVEAMTVETTGYTVSMTGLTDELLAMASITVNDNNYTAGNTVNASTLTTDDVQVNPVPGYHGEASIQGTTLTITYTPITPIELSVTISPASGKVQSLNVISVNFGDAMPMPADEFGLAPVNATLTCGNLRATFEGCQPDMTDAGFVNEYTFTQVTTEGNWTFTIPAGSLYVSNEDYDFAPVADIIANYTIGETTEPTAINVTYNIYADGELIRSTTVQNENVGEAPTYRMPEVPSYVTVLEGLPETLSATDTEVNIQTIYTTALPFSVGSDYGITLNSKMTSWNGSNFALGNAAGSKMAFTVGGDWLNGFTFKNKQADKYLTFGNNASPTDNTKATVTTNPDEAGARLDLVISGGKNYLKLHGTTNDSYANNRSEYFSTWASPNNIGNAGSQVAFSALTTYTISITGDLNGSNPYVSIGGTQYHDGDQVTTVANLNKSSITTSDISGRTALVEIVGTQITVRYVQGQSTGNTNPSGTTVQADKIYRIYSVRHAGWMMTERLNNTVGTINFKGTKDYAQMWVVTANGSDGYSIRNVNTGRYIQFPNQNATAQTVTGAVKSYIINKNATSHYYGISENAQGSGNKNLNTNTNTDNVLGWSMGDDVGSQWVFEEVATSEITLAEVKARIKELSPFSELVSGRYYRLQSYTYTDRYMAEAYTTDGKIWGYQPGKVANQSSLIWKIEGNATNGYTLQNVLTGHYIADQANQSQQFPTTATAGSAKKFMAHAEGGDEWSYPHYAFHRGASNQQSLHCANSQSYWVVNWTYNGANASFWNLEPVELSDDELAEIARQYADYLAQKQDLDNVNTNAATLNSKLHKYFADYACTTLNDVYANKTDTELTAAMAADGLPVAAQQMAVSVKNDTWTTASTTHNKWEKFFRISDFECYSKNTVWNSITGTGAFAELINPTGITVKTGDVVYIYVGSDVHDADATIGLQLSNDTGCRAASRTGLHKGINAWMSTGDGELFIDYTLNNPEKYLKDYPAIKVHIEGGTATGCWDMHRGMTDADWAWLSKNSFTDTFLHVKGHSTVLNLLTDNVRGADNVTGIMKIWDFIFDDLQLLIGHDGQWDGRYRPVINPRHAYSGSPNWGGYGGSNHPSIDKGYLFNFEKMVNDVGHLWEIYHEEAHGHQGPINMAATTESSNNGYAQMVNYDFGSYNSRNKGVETLIIFKNNNWGWVDILRGGEGTSRSNNFEYYGDALWAQCHLFFQLSQYFHIQGNMPDFWPRVNDWLRANGGLQKGSKLDNPTLYQNDYLKFARACAAVSQTDLYEFFDAWGFFKYYDEVTVGNSYEGFYSKDSDELSTRFVGDYGSYYIKMPSRNNPTDVQYLADLKAFMNSQPKKAPNIMFIDDHIKDMPVTDTCFIASIYPSRIGTPQKYFGVTPGTSGEVGMFTEFTGKNIADNIDYTISGTTVTVTGSGYVGIKIYDADGKLIYLANKHEFTVPADIATKLQNGTYTLVAALADQTNLPIAKPGTPTYALTVYNGKEDDTQTYESSGTVPNPDIPYTANNGKDCPALTDNAIQFIEATNDSSLPASLQNLTNTLYRDGDGDWLAPSINLTDKKDYYSPATFTAEETRYRRTNTAGLNSVCMPFPVSTDILPEGSKIYTLTEVTETYLAFTETDEVFAGTFCLVQCPDDTPWEIDIQEYRTLTGIPEDHTNSIGSFQNTTVGAGHYKLGGDGTKFGITTDSGKVTAFRGYIDAPAAAGVKSLSFRLEDATVGIDGTPAAAHGSLPTYDLNGRPVKTSQSEGSITLQRGRTYIINGKKMIVR